MPRKVCHVCKKESPLISGFLGVCLECLRFRPFEAQPYVKRAHEESRVVFNLPKSVPGDADGKTCSLCALNCQIPEGGGGFCGLKKVKNGVILGLDARYAKVSWYLDPLPTNCVADWICPGSSKEERGNYNLAVFFHACNLNCLYCQNWHFRELTSTSRWESVDAMLSALNERVSCVCFFGGDPSPQVHYAINFSQRALKKKKKLRICWETNGLFSKKFLKKVVELSLESGGIIKFDLKAYSKEVHLALTGYTNEAILENFAEVAKYFDQRKSVPLLTASTLLVPGYIDEKEIEGIAKFIASLNPEIPYRLLAFYPHFYMRDLPLTSKEFAYRALEIAKRAGLKRVSLGNIHLLR